MKRLFIYLSLLASLGLAPASWANSQIHTVRGFMPDLKFELISAKQESPFTEKDVADKVVLMFFGYASCPDICPTTMAQLAEVMEKLGDNAEQVRILLVSVDLYRDTSELLQDYVDIFEDRYAIGLTGTPKQIAQVARRYRVAYQVEKPKDDTSTAYEVAHSRGVYFFDGEGKARYLASDSEEVEALVEKVKTLL